ncbi:ROK family transcriptional regulator [Paenibacillus paeoniae]|uniref:ROK family transcriptional regulator n=1 Tax=Paenibacillus paeoniae TaxID=2292705 RepID=A0A371PGP9_9BACL|nr:ROK family transcriptional regulator [Paenibacillus paeoniae]REK75127.1 ROK family transcriptional regulator [Paenibacillus paeoniae]
MKVTTTGDLTLIKKINTAIVLEALVKNAPLSRAKISELTGLNKATVSNLVQDLINSNLALEIGTGESSGGRKPVMLLFNGQAGYAIGIDLGVNYIRGVLTDLEGALIAETNLTLKNQQQDFVLDKLVHCISTLIDKAPESAYGIVGIGVGVPGIVDDHGTMFFAPNLKWGQLELQRMLEDKFNLPVTIDNEANAGAQGEQNYGAGRGVAHQIYVSVGIGIGTGIILNNELYKGASGFSGELGHLSIEYKGKRCSCGNDGCWELYASENALLQMAEPLGFDSLDDMLQAAQEGNEEVRALFSSVGDFLGIGISSIVNIFNPELVIIGNRMSRAKLWLEEAIQASVARRTLPHHRNKLRILFAELQEQSAVRGAAYYAIHHFFTKMKSN